MARHALLLNFALVNVVAIGLIIAAWVQGWLDGFGAPTIWVMALAIASVFVWGLIVCGIRIWRVERHVQAFEQARHAAPETRDQADDDAMLREFLATPPAVRERKTSVVQMQLGHQIGNVRHISNSLVFLGLIGTVVGFIIGLAGVDAAAASDVNKVGPMITQLINGMSVALYTTLLGAVLNIWLNINIRLLTTGAVQLLSIMSDFEGGHGTG